MKAPRVFALVTRSSSYYPPNSVGTAKRNFIYFFFKSFNVYHRLSVLKDGNGETKRSNAIVISDIIAENDKLKNEIEVKK